MSAGILFGKRTWIGIGVTIGVLILMLLLGALLIVRGILPMGAVSPWLWVSYGLAVLIGGRVAATGQGRQLCALVPGVVLYILAWLLALCSECTIDFAANGLGITAAIAIGMLIAFMSSSRKKKHRRNKAAKRPSVRTIRR